MVDFNELNPDPFERGFARLRQARSQFHQNRAAASESEELSLSGQVIGYRDGNPLLSLAGGGLITAQSITNGSLTDPNIILDPASNYVRVDGMDSPRIAEVEAIAPQTAGLLSYVFERRVVRDLGNNFGTERSEVWISDENGTRIVRNSGDIPVDFNSGFAQPTDRSAPFIVGFPYAFRLFQQTYLFLFFGSEEISQLPTPYDRYISTFLVDDVITANDDRLGFFDSPIQFLDYPQPFATYHDFMMHRQLPTSLPIVYSANNILRGRDRRIGVDAARRQFKVEDYPPFPDGSQGGAPWRDDPEFDFFVASKLFVPTTFRVSPREEQVDENKVESSPIFIDIAQLGYDDNTTVDLNADGANIATTFGGAKSVLASIRNFSVPLGSTFDFDQIIPIGFKAYL